MLPPSLLQELRLALAALVDQRRLIDDAIEALDRLIAGVPVGGVAPVTPDAGYVVGLQNALRSESQITAHAAPTIKSLVKDVLRERPGLKSAAVTQILRQRGFKPRGSTRMTHRVFNEIWRMTQNGEVERTEQGGFRLTEKGEQT